MIGFDTIGNATIIVHDGDPVLVTDPWISGSPYFGSWTMSHEIPGEQREHIARAPYVWFSHAHPDHTDAQSLDAFRGKQVLLADHVGGRLAHDLTTLGLNVRVVPDRRWLELSKHVRIMTIADYNQDSILLVDVNGYLIINLNDANDRGWGSLVKRIVRDYRGRSFLLKLSGYGDADMINLRDEAGELIPPVVPAGFSVGERIELVTEAYGASYFIPFSSFHRYQREDSVWANRYVTQVSDYGKGFDSRRCRLLPAFVRVNCETGDIAELHPPVRDVRVRAAAEFGDNWADPLEVNERQDLKAYFLRKERLRDHFAYLRFVVGGVETIVDLGRGRRQSGISFHVPRASLVSAVRYQIFDDLLIGNFMKTTLHGGADLYSYFTPTVAKYADNGRAESKRELREYFVAYARRSPLPLLRLVLEQTSEGVFRKLVPGQSLLYRATKRVYWFVKRRSATWGLVVATIQDPVVRAILALGAES